MTLGKVTPSKYIINNNQLENVIFYKDLGIIFENNLLFNKHIDYKTPRALLNAYKIYCNPF